MIDFLIRTALISSVLNFACLSAGASQEAEAQYRRGISHDAGNGVDKDPVVAAKWYQLAAENGHVEAQYMLGLAYQSGRGVPMSREEALAWFQRAAALGHARAQAFIKVAGEQSAPAAEVAAQPGTPRAKGTVVMDQELFNGGFEVRGADATDLFALWVEAPSSAGSVARDSDVSRSGRASCRFKVDGIGTYVSVRTPSELGIEAGRRYRIGFWARSDAGGGMQVSSTVGGAFYSTGPLDIGFRRFECEFVSDGGQLNIGRQYRISNGATLWLDDVMIEALD